MNQLLDFVGAFISAACQLVLLPLLAVVELFFVLLAVIKFSNRLQLKAQQAIRHQAQLVASGTRRSVTVIRNVLPHYHH